MSNIEKLNNVFVESFQVQESALQGLEYKQVPLWDSVGQMTLIANIEDAFDIQIQAEDIMDINSYVNSIRILSQKYNIEF